MLTTAYTKNLTDPRTLDAVGNVQDARLVDTATNAMLPTLLVLGGSVYLVRRRRSDAARI